MCVLGEKKCIQKLHTFEHSSAHHSFKVGKN